MLWLALAGPVHAMENQVNQVLVIRIKIPNSGAVDWTVHSGPQLLFRDVLVSGNLGSPAPWLRRVGGPSRGGGFGAVITPWGWPRRLEPGTGGMQ